MVLTNMRDESWYCVACRPRAEEVVCLQLTKAENLTVFYPKMFGRDRKGKTTPMFPGYLFVRMELSRSLSSIRYTPGVRDVVRFGEQIPVVPDGLIEDLQTVAYDGGKLDSELHEGTKGYIGSGVLCGFCGTVVRLSLGKDRVQLLIDLLGRAVVLDVERNCVRVGE